MSLRNEPPADPRGRSSEALSSLNSDDVIPTRQQTERTSPPPRPQDYIANTISNILQHALQNNIGNPTSDYSYVLSLFPFLFGSTPGSTYTGPCYLPHGNVFVNGIGWMDAEETVRYLMMGYPVWDDFGRRLHFPGTSLGYDCLQKPFRYDRKYICHQDSVWKPDLWVQIEGRAAKFQSSPQSSIPWDLGAAMESMEGRVKARLEEIKWAWMRSRFECAKPCFAPLSPTSLTIKEVGGEILDSTPLKETPESREGQMVVGPYSQLQVQRELLSTQYPPTCVKLEIVDGKDLKTSDGLCELCASIDFKEVFEWGTVDLEIDLGSMQDLMAKPHCNFCRLLSILYQDGLRHMDKTGPTSYGSDLESNILMRACLVRNPILCLSTKPFLVLINGQTREYLGPIISLRTVRGDIRGTYTMNVRQFIDFDRLATIVQNCVVTHPDCSRRKSQSGGKLQQGMIFIDVENMCLIQSSGESPGCRYITLSYVWGQKPVLKTTKANFQNLLTGGALLNIGLSQLIEDSVTVSRALGVQYLWVDTLCIIQDDLSHKAAQIHLMPEIYERSYLTLVSLTGVDSRSPLPGVSQPYPQLVEIVQGMPFTVQLSALPSIAKNTVYEQRGWTLQERLISRRCLYFDKQQLFFECGHGCLSLHEQILPPNDRGRYSHKFNPLNNTPTKQPSISARLQPNSLGLERLELISSCISQYTSRTLSFPSDILNAFIGIQSFFAANLPWTVVTGIHTGIFDWALLWLPQGQLERRVWTEGQAKICAPSWSWMGWAGQVSYAAYTYHSKPLLQNLRPRISGFLLKIADQKYDIKRYTSSIWHPDFNIGTNSITVGEGVNSGLPELSSFEERILLEFEAEATPALRGDGQNFRAVIEWLNTGEDYGMLRHGLRHGYNDTILQQAQNRGENSFKLLAMAVCDIQHTFRGGQFNEEKLFEVKDQLVVMLVHWDDESAERIAIGYMAASDWDTLRAEKKTVRLH